MPCRSDYPAPTYREKERQAAAKRLVFFAQKTKLVPLKKWMTDDAKDCYCQSDKAMDLLCSTLRKMPDKDRKKLLRQSGPEWAKLNLWWEEHKLKDAERLAAKAAAKKVSAKKAALMKKARGVFSAEELKILGVRDTTEK